MSVLPHCRHWRNVRFRPIGDDGTMARSCRMAEVQPDTFLQQGARVLTEKLEPLGYKFAITPPPLRGSGGPFAWAAFSRGDRQIRLWARYGRLGGVHYRAGRG
jgi:hypothetical protein